MRPAHQLGCLVSSLLLQGTATYAYAAQVPAAPPVLAAQAGPITGNPLADLLLTQTGLGLVAGVFALIAYNLWGENKKLQTQINALQEQRIADRDKSTTALLDMNTKVHDTTDKLAEILDRTTEKRLR